MSWVSLSDSAGKSGENSYKEAANEAFTSPTNLSSRLGNRTPSKDGDSTAPRSISRRTPRSHSDDEAETFHQMFDSTAVQVPQKPRSSGDLGDGLKSLTERATRQYYGTTGVSSVGAEVSGNGSGSSTGKDSFSIGSVSRRTNDLDLARNDNSFHVIGGLIVEFFHSKQKAGQDDLRLTPQDIAQLDRLAPPRVRASFVDAVRFRYTNAPMDSTSSVHMLARQCHDLGLDAEGSSNPLLVAAKTEIVAPVPRAQHNDSSTGSAYPASPVSGHNSGSDQYEDVAPISDNSFGRPTRSDAADPPTGSGGASVATRLTQFGVEVPARSDASSSGESGATATRQAAGAASVQGTVTSSLTKFGIEMPRYETRVASRNTSSTHSQASHVSEGHRLHQSSQQSHHSQQSHRSQQSHHSQQSQTMEQQLLELQSLQSRDAEQLTVVENPSEDPGVHSIMSGTDDESTILHPDDSKDFGGLARQQLLAELREATNLMSESKTQEAAKFWRDHVVELEARLKALDGGDNATSTSSRGGGIEKPNQTKALTDAILSSQSRQSTQAETFLDENQVEKEVEMAARNSENGNGQYAPPSANGSRVGDEMQNDVDMGSTRGPTPMFDHSLEGVPMVDVVAPADLPGGYNFEAEIEGRRFLATVPAGGVQKGETFSCYMRDLEKVGSDIPVGRWRDGLFDCFKFGCLHGVICNALFCPLVMLGQIMTRVGFDFLGRRSLDNSVNGPSTLSTIMFFWVFVNLVLFGVYNLKWSKGMELSMADQGAFVFVNAAYMLFVVYLTSATRGSLREKYYIRESRFHDLEDCCCATFCLPCSICQMARHTADYDEYEAVLCNATGLPDIYESTQHTDDMSPVNSYVV